MNQFIQAKTMIPVMVVHLLQQPHLRYQSWVGITHSFISYITHLSIWWAENEWTPFNIRLYTADKCFIAFMMWGFHYHFDPYSAKWVALPIMWDISQIVLYQPFYVGSKFAYFDIVLLTYLLYVSLLVISMMRSYHWIGVGILTTATIGYMFNICGLMHLSLAPGFWLWYQEIKERKKNITTTINKEHVL